MARLTFFAGEDKPDTREGRPANLPADPGAPRPHEGGDPSTASGNPDEEELRTIAVDVIDLMDIPVSEKPKL